MTNLVLPYKRVILKLSGESLMGKDSFGINPDACKKTALAIKALRDGGVEVGVVIGGGNIFRGLRLEQTGLERTPADQMGMLATLMNGIALQEALSSLSCQCKLMSALECPKITDSFNRKQAIELIQRGHVILFVGGTGNPYFTTDTAAALRASEIKADILLKATKVDGIYDKDPIKYPDAKKFETLSYSQALADHLQVMDATALALCRENSIPILVFNLSVFTEDKILKALSQKNLGTIVGE